MRAVLQNYVCFHSGRDTGGWRTVIAFFFARSGLIKHLFAAKAALIFAIFLGGGIIGTLHHLYFSGTSTVAFAFGSVFSALEVVPIILIAYAAMDDLRCGQLITWATRYRWPIYFFVSVPFWNMIVAGLFRFMINPPILYYVQELTTIPLRGHAALFGVYAHMSARTGTPSDLARRMATLFLPGDEHRSLLHVYRQLASGRSGSDAGVHEQRLLFSRSPEFMGTH